MKSTELMIGDWVSYGGTPIKVENVHGDCMNFQHDIPFVQEEFMIEITKVKPIPLTIEILEKNGFEQAGDSTFSVSDDGMLLNATWWRESLFYVGFYRRDNNLPNEHFFLNVCYVHELQHILRLCGQNELADKFKF